MAKSAKLVMSSLNEVMFIAVFSIFAHWFSMFDSYTHPLPFITAFIMLKVEPIYGMF